MKTAKISFLLIIIAFVYLGAFPLNAKEACDRYSHLTTTLSECFPKASLEDIKIVELKGGFSQTSLYRIEAEGNTYVLRILQSQQINAQDSVELFCLKEASKMGISPKIHYISPDGKIILMEFVQEKTLSMAQANSPENVVKLAKTFRIAHQMAGHPKIGESLLSKAQRCAQGILCCNIGPKHEIEHALELVKKYTLELQECRYEKVHVHGDLNPRNIFLTQDKVYLIDWADTTFEDPFFDLTYFSLMLCYNKSNEELLLKSYLEHVPTEEEWFRYNLHKKIHLAFWSLTDLYLTHVELKKNPDQKIIYNNPPQSWEFYQKTFSDYLEDIPAQYFYDLSRICYQRALP